MEKKKILIAEDDAVLRSILVDKLNGSGFDALGAEDGEKAMNVLHTSHIDLLLLDILMPKKNGMQVMEEMHADRALSSVPIVVISNSGQPVEIERAKKLGAKDFLIKATFEPKEVLEKVQKILGGPEHETVKKSRGNGANILVVEDDKFLRELLLEKLATRGYKARGAVNGKEALAAMEKNRPDLVLLDIILPDINGFEILASMRGRANLKDMKVIILSNLDQKEDYDRAQTHGVKAYMIKSNFSLGEIIAKIEEVISEDK